MTEGCDISTGLKACRICHSLHCRICWEKCYNKYLRSAEWQEMRRLLFDRDKHKCVKCGSEDNLQAAHLHDSYSEYFARPGINFLITLCRGCHLKYDRPTDAAY